MIQSPSDPHGTFAFMGDICRRTQQPEGPVISGEARNRQRCAPAPVGLLVAPAGWTVRTSTGLAFHMDPLAANRQVPPSGGRGTMSAGLGQGKSQSISYY